MTSDEIEALYQSIVKNYMLCKHVSNNEAVEHVRLDVVDELERRGMGRLRAAVTCLEVSRKLTEKKRK